MQITNAYNEGYFSWSVTTDGLSRANSPAPDGEEYFAMALLFASHRWGDGKAPFDYSTQAKYILKQMIHSEDQGTGTNMWDKPSNLVSFVPGSILTDPSYGLPHFYELFSLWGNTEDKKFWAKAADSSRAYLKKACNPVTGLASDYTNFNGVPTDNNGQGHDKFSYDAFRVAGNIGLDYSWFAADAWEKTEANKLQAFFVKEGLGKYSSIYKVDGTPDTSNSSHSLGLAGMNAMASLAADGPNVKAMVEEVWNAKPIKGTYRYYDNCLYFFSLLALSGNYRVW